MTTEKLHKILEDENRKLTAEELKEVVYQLKQDTFKEYGEALEVENLHISQFYLGETKAFEICLDILEHLKEVNDRNRVQ